MKETKLYIFDATSECMGNGPLDMELRPLSVLDKAWLRPRVAVKVPFLDEYPDLENLADAPDVISLGNSFAVSGRTRACISLMTVDPKISVVPASIINRRGINLGDYYWYWSDEWVSIINRATASFTKYPRSEMIKEVTRWAIDWKSLPDVDLLRSELLEWIVTDRFKCEIERAGVTGCRFRPIVLGTAAA